jgi:hypothetical protein
MTGRKNEERNTEKQRYKQKHVLYIFTVTFTSAVAVSSAWGTVRTFPGIKVSLRSPSV